MASRPRISEHELDRLALSADLLARYPFRFWHYGDSIGFEGLLAAADLLADARFAGFVHGALKAWAARAEPYAELDNTAPGHALCLAHQHTADAALLGAAHSLASWLTRRPTVEGAYVSFASAPLLEPYGGEQLPAAERGLLDDPGPGVFLDCLHFDPPFLAHLGRLTGEAALSDAAAGQARAYIRLLQDESGLFWHFHLARTGSRYGFAWGRGQGWALLGLLDTLELLPPGHAARPELSQALVRLADALAAHQRADGGWPTVVSERDSPPESSTAAFAAAGFARAVRQGLLGDAFRERALGAWDATISLVDADGSLRGVSAAVWASTAQSHYRHVPTGFDVPWGLGPLLVAAREIAALARGS